MHYKELSHIWRELTQAGAPFELSTIPDQFGDVRVYRHAPATLQHLWQGAVAFGERDYLVFENQRVTYSETAATSARIAGWLHARGVCKGDRVVIAMRNYPEWMLIFWACMSLGAIAVGFNAWWTATEMDAAVEAANPKVAFVDAERLVILRQSRGIESIPTIVAVQLNQDREAEARNWSDALGFAGSAPRVAIDPSDTASIFYTSGTSGQPKGVELTHQGCITNIFNVMFWARAQALAHARAKGLAEASAAPPPAVLLTTPLFHVTANNCGAQVATALGGKVVLMRRWDAGQALRLVATERITTFSSVPVMARELISHPDFAATDLSSLASIGGGGAQMQPDLVARVDGATECVRASTGYGMTEASGVISSISGDFFADKPTSCGRALPTFDIKCVDDAGQSVEPGAIGELCVRGSTVTSGYWNGALGPIDLSNQGWLHTGDLARIDGEGFIHIVDRKKDMVLRGGENVFCAEVEAAIHAHPAVRECCVFGVKDSRLGEAVAAAIVLERGAALTADDLREFCGLRLAYYKVPAIVRFLANPIPRNAAGKFLKRRVREDLGLA
ncbi:MAG: class I adenylate-forming enzyme family protein [Hyphomonadaceae bacterium]